ncbi:SAGA-Tad1 domain-containing protein [Cephalotus follicularis]|uniref:SAGA-Tad1 domain-containing protein n=1 Tax=Cephalotus follicularis TaxID=3775 RepID=A0A1Q3CD79_CEPFO|nr:SAGA-Tad1 domain-containing protein [Cephalotus follicularis]
MQLPHQRSRINLAELKAQIVKKLGLERSKLYFYYLNKLLSLKLGKVEFNKLSVGVLGRENVPLHNQFISSILKNVCHAKVPPPPLTHGQEVLKSTSKGSVLPNGVVLHSACGKVGSEITVGPNGMVDSASHQSSVTKDNVVLVNWDLNSCNTWKPVQHHKVVLGKTKSKGEPLLHRLAKLKLIKGSINGFVEERSGKLQAPLGIPFCSVSVGRALKALSLVSSTRCSSSYDSGVLFDTKILRERMQQIAVSHGLDRVSVDCANLLNNGLDAYLKSLIRSCIELVGTRWGRDLTSNSNKQQSHGKLVNGVLPGHLFQELSSSRPFEGMLEQRPYLPISLLDFMIAMELNPHQLGEDWPLLLEKICLHSFEK